jgi:hypothetical protein
VLSSLAPLVLALRGEAPLLSRIEDAQERRVGMEMSLIGALLSAAQEAPAAAGVGILAAGPDGAAAAAAAAAGAAVAEAALDLALQGMGRATGGWMDSEDE